MPVDVAPVINDWMGNETIIQRAAVYKLMNFELGTTPEAAEAHSLIIGPTMKHLGLKPSIDIMRTAVARLLHCCRPVGAKPPPRSTIRKTAWYIRRLISNWKRWAKRGTCPRNQGQKMLFEAADIPWPERSAPSTYSATTTTDEEFEEEGFEEEEWEDDPIEEIDDAIASEKPATTSEAKGSEGTRREVDVPTPPPESSLERPLPSAPKEDENMDKQLQVLLAIEIELENLEKLYQQKMALESAEDRTTFLNKTGGMDAAETLPMPALVMDELAQAPPDSLPMETLPQEVENETPSICKLNTLRLDDTHEVKETQCDNSGTSGGKGAVSACEPGQSEGGTPTLFPERSSVKTLTDPPKTVPAAECPAEASRVDLPAQTVEAALQVMRSTAHLSPTEQTKLTKAAKTSKKKGKGQEETDEESDGSEDEQSTSSKDPKTKAKATKAKAKAKTQAKAKARAKTDKGQSSKPAGEHDQPEPAKKPRTRKAKATEADKETQEDKPPKAKRAKHAKDLEEDKKAKEGDQPEMVGKAGDLDKEEEPNKADQHEPLKPKRRACKPKRGENLETGQSNTTPPERDAEVDQATTAGGEDKPEPKKPRRAKEKEQDKQPEQTKGPAKRKRASTANEGGKSKEKAEKDNQRSRKCCAYSKAYKMYLEMHGELEARKRAREAYRATK
eukprot:s546_g7.t1